MLNPLNQERPFNFEELFSLFDTGKIDLAHTIYTLNKGNYENTIIYYVKRKSNNRTDKYFEFISEKYTFSDTYNRRMLELLIESINEDKFINFLESENHSSILF